MAKKVVTLYIDDFNIRLLVAKGKQVQKWARLPLEQGLVQDGVIIDEAQVVDKLKELFKLTNIAPSEVMSESLVEVMATRITDSNNTSNPKGKTSTINLGSTSPGGVPGKSLAPAVPATPMGTAKNISTTPAIIDPFTAVSAALADCHLR